MKHDKKIHVFSNQTQKQPLNLRAVFLFIVLFASVGIGVLMAHGAGSATLSLSQTDNADGVLTVAIYENSGTSNVGSVEADLKYDSTQLDFASIDATSSAFPSEVSSAGSNGSVQIQRALSSGSVSGNQYVGSVSFISLGTATSTFVSFAPSSSILRSPDSINIWNQDASGLTFTLTDAPTAGPVGRFGGGNSPSSSNSTSSETSTPTGTTPPATTTAPQSSGTTPQQPLSPSTPKSSAQKTTTAAQPSASPTKAGVTTGAPGTEQSASDESVNDIALSFIKSFSEFPKHIPNPLLVVVAGAILAVVLVGYILFSSGVFAKITARKKTHEMPDIETVVLKPQPQDLRHQAIDPEHEAYLKTPSQDLSPPGKLVNPKVPPEA